MPKVIELCECRLCKRFFTFAALICHLQRRHGDVGEKEAERLKKAADPSKHLHQRPNSLHTEEDSLEGSSKSHEQLDCPENAGPLKKDHVDERIMYVPKYTPKERTTLLRRLAGELSIPVPELPFKCEQCSESFGTKRELSAHVDELHSTRQSPPLAYFANEFICVFDGCDLSFTSLGEFANHCATQHKEEAQQNFEVFTKSFETMDDLLVWKSEIEELTCTSFRIRHSSRQTTEYECHRSVSFIPKSQRGVEANGSAKHCTAFMECRVRKDGAVEVTGCTDHVGHMKDPEKLLFTAKQKDELRSLIASGLSASEIMEKMKEKYDGQSRMHYLTSTDLALLDESHDTASTSADVTHQCPECGAGPMSLVELRSHALEMHEWVEKQIEVEKEHDKAKGGYAYYHCDQCSFACFTETFLDTHVQTYHPYSRSEDELQLPVSSPVTCAKCQMSFRTTYLLAVHCIGAHSSYTNDFTILQTSFVSWAKFEPWRTMMERDSNTAFVKSGMQAWGTKLIHSYNCQFDRTVVTGSFEEKENKGIDCPAFVKVIENEDGILDCAACFGHLGHKLHGVSSDELNEEDTESQGTYKGRGAESSKDDAVKPCFICGNVIPPEVDAMTALDVKWCCCSAEECQALAHEWCTRVLGKKCFECDKGVLIGSGEDTQLLKASVVL